MMNCRFCKSHNSKQIVKLGEQVPSNFNLEKVPKLFPLNIFVCKNCFLVQTEDFISEKKLFGENYPYYSSYSYFWIEHAKKLADECIKKFKLNTKSFVVEIASNDGYLLKNFKEKKISCLGIEPSNGPALVAEKKGINVIKSFFSYSLSKKLVKDGMTADLLIANNVVAHVPDILDFIRGIENLLNPSGVAVLEFQYLIDLIKKKQFDTMYHEHFSYLSVLSLNNILSKTNLEIFNLKKLQTHGGSNRVFLKKTSNTKKSKVSKNVSYFLKKEKDLGVNNLKFYEDFENQIEKIVFKLKNLINLIKKEKKILVGYGAAAKSSCIINAANITEKELDYVVDKNPHKQNTFIPGTKIPIVDESFLKKKKPDYILIFPWNIKNEIKEQISYTKKWGAKIFVCIPSIKWLKNG